MFMAMTLSFASGAVFALQNDSLNRVEKRIANLRTNAMLAPTGLSFGDETIDTALWSGIFGTVAHQKPTTRSLGYNATSSGGLLGLDHRTWCGDIYGLALGISNSNLHESMHHGFVNRILGWHIIVYGSNTLASESFFIEWLATGVINRNKGTTYNNSNLGVESNYSTTQGGVRINFGQATDNDNWAFSLIEMISYTVVYQPSYHQTNSTWALHVTPQELNNIFTLGGGVRLAVYSENEWLSGVRELHFMGTYDVAMSEQVTVANFLNGVSDFSISSAAGPWAFLVGATYTCTFFERLQLQLSYDFQLREKYTDNSGEIKIRYLF